MRVTDGLLVCATLAVGAALALPGFGDSSLRTRRGEALEALRTISELQDDFYLEHEKYSDSYSELGFSPRGFSQRRRRLNGSVRGETYTYALTAWEHAGQRSGNYRATATGNLDSGDEILDIIIIENELVVAGATVDANTPVILSDDILKTITPAVSASGGGAAGYRGEIASEP